MIIDNNDSNNMSHLNDPNTLPPSYDSVVGPSNAGPSRGFGKSSNSKPQGFQYQANPPSKSNALIPHPAPSTSQSPVVYHYVNPQTQQHITSLLPPDHPQMICLQNAHIPHTEFGILGILGAIVFFPLGVALCLVDRKSVCKRCGLRLDG